MCDFQTNLKQLRILKGFKTAKEFSSAVGLPYTTYINYENKGREPEYKTLCKIADTLHVAVDDLLGHKIDEWESTKRTLENYGYKFHPVKMENRFSQNCFELTNKAGYIIPVTDKREISLLVSRAKAESSLIAHSLLESFIEKAFYNLQVKRCMDLGIIPQAERSTDHE